MQLKRSDKYGKLLHRRERKSIMTEVTSPNLYVIRGNHIAYTYEFLMTIQIHSGVNLSIIIKRVSYYELIEGFDFQHWINLVCKKNQPGTIFWTLSANVHWVILIVLVCRIGYHICICENDGLWQSVQICNVNMDKNKKYLFIIAVES